MGDELREAAERLRRWLHEDEPSPFLEPDSRVAEEIRDAALLLAAEHPADDGEPTTPEWLRPLCTNPGLLFEFGDGCSVWFVFSESERYIVISDGVNHGADLPMPPTRGAVRRLFAALGVPLKE